MKPIFCLLLAAAITILSAHATAQTPIRPGDDHLDYSLVRPSHDFYKNITIDSAGHVLYEFMMDNTMIIDTPHQRIIFARSRQVPVGSTSMDTSITDMHLRPLVMHEWRPQRAFDIIEHFDPELATVTITRKGVADTKTYPMKKGFFEENMIEYIFGLLILNKDQTYVLDNFNVANSGNAPYTIKYSFDDVLNFAGDAIIPCTVLYFTYRETTGYIWIDKSNHKVLKEIGHAAAYTYVVMKQ